jgi:16S rRNA (guanine(966)-N(2))-methyltransferase RsmD
MLGDRSQSAEAVRKRTVQNMAFASDGQLHLMRKKRHSPRSTAESTPGANDAGGRAEGGKRGRAAEGEKRGRTHAEPAAAESSAVRVIGGDLRGRKIAYTGDPRTRPMKDRVREALFNLIGPSVKGSHVLDLFAGTGALGIEALSRGANRATFFEKHFPTGELLGKSLAELGLLERGEVIAGDTFVQVRRMRRDGPCFAVVEPWVIFCSPPYDFYVDRRDEVLKLLDDLLAQAPLRSIVVVEADRRFDFGQLPHADEWRVREYAPAVVGIYRSGSPGEKISGWIEPEEG